MLAQDVVAWTDGGGKHIAARNPVFGTDAVSRFFVGLAKKGVVDGFDVSLVEVNGWPALAMRLRGVTDTVLTIQTDGERIYGVYVVSNPDKLRRLA